MVYSVTDNIFVRVTRSSRQQGGLYGVSGPDSTFLPPLPAYLDSLSFSVLSTAARMKIQVTAMTQTQGVINPRFLQVLRLIDKRVKGIINNA